MITKLTKAEARVKIAKDAIARIRAGQYELCHYSYLDVVGVYTPVNQQALSENPKCEVCAAGALLGSLIKIFNKFDFDDSKSPATEVVRGLSRYFSETQVFMIEAAFEQTQYPLTG